MPTYGYKCTECNDEFEIMQKITADPLKKCEKCEGTLKKLLYPVGIVFKGSGFHINDYRKADKLGGNGHAETKSASESTSKPDDNGHKDNTPAADSVKQSVEKAAEKVEAK